MKLRGIKDDYSIGLDLGTGSAGWAVVNSEGELTYFKNKPTWGSRLFDSAQPASAARLNRGQRRRYVRRRWRLNLLQSLFDDEIQKVDPEFFIHLRQSRLLKEDRAEGHEDYRWPLFDKTHPLLVEGKELTEPEYYAKFPTIYHLRKWLMETDEQADIRLIYLAFHNIVKHRGNFLRQGEKLSAKNANAEQALKGLFDESEDNPGALQAWCLERGYEYAKPSITKIKDILGNEKAPNSQKASDIAALIGVSIPDDTKASKDCNKALAQAIVGLSAEFKNIFGECSADKTKFKLSDDEAVDAMREGGCPDDSFELFEGLYGVYLAYILQGLLAKAPGETISSNMAIRYEKYGQDLKILKELVREYAPVKYNDFFRGATYEGTDIYNASEAKGYTKYDLGTQKMGYEDFVKEVEKLFKGTPATSDERYSRMMEEFDKQDFLRRLKTSDNGSIYYQLHLEEMDAILENQKQFYPFLQAEKEKIESLVSFRIPYYVGPLQTKNAAKDAHGKQRFAWAERKPGQEDVAITPWNWDQVIDRNKSAESFILRMTGNCTYIQGEPVLPKCSLLYEEFCVLNELNGARMTLDGDDWKRFDAAQREGMLEDLFKHYKTISYKRLQEWLEREENLTNAHVKGGQGETGFESKLSSYIFFCKDVFKADSLNKADYPMIEEIILWNTLFEDRKILKERLENKYGSAGTAQLSDEQIKVICKKRFTGWGRLSEKLLTGIKITADGGAKYSVMDVLRGGNPLSGERVRTMILMEILHDDKLGFQKRIDAVNRQYYDENSDSLGVNELPGSPAIRRSINQAIRIVDEITSIAGKEPKNIFIEVTRDDEDPRQKNRRTKRRYDNLKEALSAFKKEDPQVWNELNERSNNDLDERLTLYFMQRGKCMYSGDPIDINRIHDDALYEVDHVIPRSYIKDDSFDNKVLVLRNKNQSKTNSMLIDKAVRQKMSGYWQMLHEAKLISDKKYNNLMRSQITDKMLGGFIARQLVETSQMVKLVQALLKSRYPETNIIPVKAAMSHDLRESVGLPKCREANDFHHAHDAFLACRVGQFIQLRYPKIYTEPIAMAHVMKARAQQEAQAFNKGHNYIGTSGFIVNGFTSPYFDKETGEVYWDASAECESLRRALNFKQCYISRMPVEDTGAFWKATIYSPHDSKMGANLSLSVKEGLNPKKYGGFSTEQFAYFFVYKAKDSHSNNVFKFAQVPTWLARRVEINEGGLQDYAQKLAEAEGLNFEAIVYPRILKKQLIEVDGDRLIITGISEVRNGTELAFNLADYKLISSAVSTIGTDPTSEEGHSLAALQTVIAASKDCGKKLGRQLKLDERARALESTTIEQQVSMIKGLLAIYNGANRVVDISPIGGSKNAGAMVTNISNLLTSKETVVYIINQSVTGMFEKRTHIGL